MLTGPDGQGSGKTFGGKKGSSQWVEGFETLFGGGHISLGAVKRRSSGIARVVSDSASVVASFVGAAKGQADGELIGEVDDEDQEAITREDQLTGQHLAGAGSVNLEASTPKDVFEFEANQTPENDPEDKP